MKKQVAAIIISSNRSNSMSGKSEKKLSGMTVLEHITGRLKRVPLIDEIFLATSDNSHDDSLCALASKIGIEICRGSVNDLISRMSNAAKKIQTPYIVKVLGNYPLIDPEMVSILIHKHLSGNYDYSYNEHYNGVLYGMGCEVINTETLLILNANKNLTINQRACGLLFLFQDKNWFKTLKLDYDNSRPDYKVCLENDKDLILLEAILKNIRVPRIESVIHYLDENPIIAKSNQQDSVHEVGIDKLYFFPDKVSALQKVASDNPDFLYPVSVEISLTNHCNLNCIWCSDKELRSRQFGDLDIRVFKSLINELQTGGTQGIVIEGGGEPLVYNQFNEAVEYVHSVGMGCGLITNGTIAIDPNILKCFDWIRVSLDASNEEEFFKLKKVPLFEKVMTNLSNYIRYCPVVGIGYVVTTQNSSRLEPLVLRLKEMQVSYIQFRPVIDHPELLTDVKLNYLKRYISAPNFNIIIDGMKENIIHGNAGRPCKAHSLTTVISADGSVYLCGRLNKYSWFESMGNINKQSFDDIWKGSVRKEQANQVLNPNFCQQYCPECRISKYNHLLDRIEHVKTRRFI